MKRLRYFGFVVFLTIRVATVEAQEARSYTMLDEDCIRQEVLACVVESKHLLGTRHVAKGDQDQIQKSPCGANFEWKDEKPRQITRGKTSYYGYCKYTGDKAKVLEQMQAPDSKNDFLRGRVGQCDAIIRTNRGGRLNNCAVKVHVEQLWVELWGQA